MSSSLADPFEGDDEDEDDTNGEPPSKPLRETSRPGSIKRVSKNDFLCLVIKRKISTK
jgi:hypothetical protein